jgi:hypothetical protein
LQQLDRISFWNKDAMQDLFIIAVAGMFAASCWLLIAVSDALMGGHDER